MKILFPILGVWFQNRRAKWRKQEKVGPQSHPFNPYLPAASNTLSTVVAAELRPSTLTHLGVNLRKSFEASPNLTTIRYPQISDLPHVFPPAYFNQFQRASSQMLPADMSTIYSPVTSFQTLLANMTGIQNASAPQGFTNPSVVISVKKPPLSNQLLQSPVLSLFPSITQSSHMKQNVLPANEEVECTVEPSEAFSALSKSENLLNKTLRQSPQHYIPVSSHIPSVSRAVALPEDRRTSSIAELRLKAREHEIRLQLLRHNGQKDIPR